MKKSVISDVPLQEITLRRYEKPYSSMSDRDLIRKFCLSMGLLQPGDSRDVIIDIFYVLLKAKKENIGLSTNEIQERVIEFKKANDLNLNGCALSNIRRLLKKIKDDFYIIKVGNEYILNENQSLTEIFDSKIKPFLLDNVLSRVKEYLNEIDNRFLEDNS